jgi:hypothetical protein
MRRIIPVRDFLFIVRYGAWCDRGTALDTIGAQWFKIVQATQFGFGVRDD